jgi:SHAQKYF class myb-like DNA-binding protein
MKLTPLISTIPFRKTTLHLSNLSDEYNSSIASTAPGITKLIEHSHPTSEGASANIRSARSVAKPARFRESPTEDLDPALECQMTAMNSKSMLHHAKASKSSPTSQTLNAVRKSSQVPTEKLSSPNEQVESAASVNHASKHEGNNFFQPNIAPGQMTGGWSNVEQAQFLQGCVLYGWGNWCLIRDTMVPTRDRHQIKSHAQKFARSQPEMKAHLVWKHLEYRRTKKVPVKVKAAPKRKPALNIKPQMQSEKKIKLSTESTNHHPVKQEAKNIDAVKNNPNSAHRKRTSNSNGTPRPSPPVGPSTTAASTGPRDIASDCEAFLNVPILGRGPENHHLKSVVNPLCTGPVVEQSNGPWSTTEHSLFETGCIKYGWGDWKAISLELTTRTRTQIKSHAQKFQRVHPLEKARLDKEHLQFCRNREKLLIKKRQRANRKAAKSAQADNRHCENKKASEGSIISKPSLVSRRASGWTFVEEKQFEDGCIFHGWGNWRDIASHIITKSMPEVFAFAQSYNRNDRESLEREHRLHYQVDDTTASDETYVPTQIHHALLGNANEGSLQNSTPSKSSIDDYGAATAILALRELG